MRALGRSLWRPASLIILIVCSASLVGNAQTGPCATIIPGQPLPDLIVDTQRLRSDIIVTEENFDRNSCAIIEGCVTSKGNHQLLRFTSTTVNVGQGDLVIGDPNNCPLYYQSQCHNHLHLDGYVDYRVWTEQGYATWIQLRDLNMPVNTGQNANLLATLIQNGDLIVGRKQGFCIIDTERYLPTASEQKKYTLCGGPGAPGNQGLQVGWSDTYGQQLDCQFVQIDKLRDGIYVLEDHVNPNHVLPESVYTNNSSAVKFQFIAGRRNRPPQISILS